jgi:hypothetical protein
VPVAHWIGPFDCHGVNNGIREQDAADPGLSFRELYFELSSGLTGLPLDREFVSSQILPLRPPEFTAPEATSESQMDCRPVSGVLTGFDYFGYLADFERIHGGLIVGWAVEVFHRMRVQAAPLDSRLQHLLCLVVALLPDSPGEAVQNRLDGLPGEFLKWNAVKCGEVIQGVLVWSSRRPAG